MSENNALVKKIMLIILGLVFIGLIGFLFIKPMIIKDELPKPVVINTQDQPTMGNPAAKVHIVAFEDLKCVNCARFNKEMMPYIQKQYIDTGIAKYTLINLAFVNGSMPAANAARCIYKQNPKLFFPFVETIFAHQPPEETDWATIPTLMDFASKIKGVDSTQLAKCLVSSPYTPFIQNNLQMAMKLMPIVQTPTIYINGVLVRPLTKSQIETVINATK